MNFSLQTA